MGVQVQGINVQRGNLLIDRGYGADDEIIVKQKKTTQLPRPQVVKPIPCKPLSLETNSLLFPRCEYGTMFEGTTHYAMYDPRHWATYFRSTGGGGNSARFTQTGVAEKTFEVPSINTPKEDLTRADASNYHGHTGTFRSPFELDEYQEALTTAEESIEEAEKSATQFEEAALYNETLQYKNQLCSKVVTGFQQAFPERKDEISVYHHNGYPCLMVSLKLDNATYNEQSEWYQESWNAIFTAYFIAITNKVAKDLGVPTELVHRSGFGYHMPTIDTTGSSFRINMGVVPEIYTEVLIQSLGQLPTIIDTAFQEQFSNYTIEGKKCIDTMNTRIPRYQKKTLPKWKTEQTIADILALPGDAKGQYIVYQLMRQRYYIDLLAREVAKELEKKEPNYGIPLVNTLMRLDFGEKKPKENVVSMKIDKSIFETRRKWNKNENPRIHQDKKFWSLIEQLFDSVNAKHTLPPNKTVLGLNARLEKANKEFIIHAANDPTIEAEDGVGSDSEYEGEYRDQQLFSKKLTVATGMMAINVAYYLARRFLKDQEVAEYRTEVDYMYYETDGVFSVAKRDPETLATRNQRKQKITTLPFFDLNHCDTTQEKACSLEEYLRKQDEDAIKMTPVIILDCTNTTSNDIAQAIQSAFDYGMELVLTVDSNLKHKQNGADYFASGTVRIFTQDEAQRDTLYEEAKGNIELHHKMPAMAHKMRKAYKSSGHAVTNGAIFQSIESVSTITKLDQMERYKDALLTRLDTLAEPKKDKRLKDKSSILQCFEDEIMDDIKTVLKKLSSTRTKRILFPNIVPSKEKITEKFNSEEIKKKIFDTFNKQFLHLDPKKMEHIIQSCVLDFTDLDTSKPGFLKTSLRNALEQYFEELQEQLAN